MALFAFGIIDCSPIEFSDLLRNLNMSHTLCWRTGLKYESYDVDGLCIEQPVWPVLIDKVKTIDKVHLEKDRLVYFVFDSASELSYCNISKGLWKEALGIETFEERVKAALQFSANQEDNWVLKKSEPALSEYINQASKASVLQEVLALFYKINPYELRKQIQTLCISYLAGKGSITALKRELKKSMKLEDLYQIMTSEKIQEFRNAVQQLSHNTVDEVAEKTGFETFDLRYIQKSFDKSKETQT